MSEHVSRFYAAYDGAAVDTDLIAASVEASASTGGPSNVPLQGGKPCQAIRAGGAGVLMVTTERGAAAKLRFVAGETQRVGARAIVAAGSTATDLTVFWDY